MIRNLVLRLPSLKCTSDYAVSPSFRQRSFRSLSPVQKVHNSVSTERSVSSSRVETGHIIDISRTPRPQTLCFSKEYYAQKPDDKHIKEKKWRENSTKKELEKNQEQFDTYEQYELEAAKPRPIKSRDIIEAFSKPKDEDNDGFFHLQPSQIKPYGSQNNIYSPTLIMPVHLIKHPKKLKKFVKKDSLENDRKSSNDLDNMGYRNYSTSSDARKVSTSRSYVAKECHNSKNIIDEISTNQNTSSMVKKSIDNIKLSSNPKESNSSGKKISSKGGIIPSENNNLDDNMDNISNEQSPNKLPKNIENLKYMLNPKEIKVLNGMPQSCKEPLEIFKRRLQFRPPEFLPRKLEESESSIKFSTKKERRERREKENKNSHLYYKSSYSDLVKLKLKEVEEGRNEILNQVPFNLRASTNKACLGCFINRSPNTSHMLKIAKKNSNTRSLTTRSKSNLISKESSCPVLDPTPKNNLFGRKSMEEIQDQRNYSKKSKSLKSKKGRATKKAQSQEREYKPECENICTSVKLKSAKKHIPLEPQSCEFLNQHKKVYLPSRVKLPVPHCVERPPYRDCKKEEKCPPRADECVVVTPKKLPKLPPGCCPCVEQPPPTQLPKLEKLHFKFEDPPRPVCHQPPCQTPRADDQNPYKHPPLKPYVPGECECVEPPPMVDIKLKRLPRCEPEEICRPKKKPCPVIEKCPERADKCLTIEPKQLPPLEVSCCPCLETPAPKTAPLIKRLNLSVPEPPRECKKPPVCTCTGRADDCLVVKRKKLPKFVPGDCPCKDKPMIDWNLKRLVCEDDVTECTVPDPCKAFPRADWGCWEYDDEICEQVDPKCIDKTEKCPSTKTLKGHPCDKPDPCKSHRERELRYMPKRKYSNSKASLKLYQKVKNQNSPKDEGHVKIASNIYKPPEIKQSKLKLPKSTKSNKNIVITNKKLKSKSTLSLIKLLNHFERTKEKEDPILFKPKEKEQLNYETILKKIASSTAVAPKQVAPKVGILAPNLKRIKNNTIRVASRAISTTKIVSKNEKDIQEEKEYDGKNKCKNIRPSVKALCKTRKMCRIMPIAFKSGERRDGCKIDRVPVCCEKEESPYSAFSDNLEESIKPYTKTPQFICNRVQYGYYPTYKKEFDPLDNSKKQETKEKKAHSTPKKCPNKSKKKDQKSYSTCTLTNGAPQTTPSFTERSRITCKSIAAPGNHLLNSKASTSIPKLSSKAFLKMSVNQRVRTIHSRTFTSKIFQIQPPVANKKPKTSKDCNEKNIVKATADQISCTRSPTPSTLRWCCKRERLDTGCKRKPPPFPAFSDCLDEEMETLLTECPLDKEKYNRIQPRFMNVLKKPLTLKPPPPVQGKLDLLKEEECVREKLCLEKGITQSCSDFGKPIPLKKARKTLIDKKLDCDRIEELKRAGRWPPLTLKQNRRLCTSTLSTLVESRQYLSTLGLNSIYEICKDSHSTTRVPIKRVDIRDYHALVKSPDKFVLNHQEIEPIQKMFPDMDESTKLLKLRKNQWRITNLKKYELLNRQNKVAKRVKRFYTTYRTKKRNFLIRKSKGLTTKTHVFRRKVSNNAKLFYKSGNMRGKRTLKSGKSINNTRRERFQYKICKRQHSKFTLNCGSSKYYRKAAGRQQGRKSTVQSFSKINNDVTLKKRARRFHQAYSGEDNNNVACGQYPEQEKINHGLSYEYYKCKNGLQNKGITFDCQSLGLCPKTSDCSIKEDFSDRSICRAKISCDKERDLAEFHVQEHQKHEEATNCVKKGKQKKDDCEKDREKLENICIQHCMKSFPCHLPEEEKYAICKAECKKVYSPCNLYPEPKSEKCEEKEVCPSIPESRCGLQKEPCPPPSHCSLKPAESETNCQPEPSISKAVICTEPPMPCPPKKSKSITQLENLWQRIVNYFKARPNCPEPGEWKKRALREKAEKAARAAGLITIDPKCLPPTILRTAQASKKDCKVCPKDNNDQKESDCDANKSAPSGFSKRNFSTSVQPSRNYSRSAIHDNLEEINRLLEEEELKQGLGYKGSNHHLRKRLAIFPERKDAETVEALKLSLDMELHKDVDFGTLCFKNKRPSSTYFGYSDIIPSRENILERAWRISIESNNVYNSPKVYNFFNEFFRKMEKNIQSIEDLEKLKTENVLRELEEFLKDEEPDKTKK